MREPASIDEIKLIVQPEHVDAWIAINPVIFYKDKQPYGLIAEVDGYIASTTKRPEQLFTIGMLKYVYEINKTKDITVITDLPEYFSQVKRGLEPFGFECSIEGDIMYSRRKCEFT